MDVSAVAEGGNNGWLRLVREPRWRGLSVILIGTFLSVIVHNVAAVTLPSIAADFGATLAEVQWVSIAVSLTTAAVVMPAGYLADRLGRRGFFIGGMALFAAASVMAGWAPSLESLIAARLLQGVATAIVGANGIAIAVTLFPEAERGKVLGLASGTVGFSALVAPAVGGVIVEAAGWRWAYHAIAVPAVIGAIGAWLVLEAGRPHEAADGQSRFDWFGSSAIAGTAVTLVLGLTMGPLIGWGEPLVWSTIAAAMALGGAYVWWELRTPHPLFDLRLLRRRAVVTPLGTRVVLLMGLAGAGFLVPFYIQGVLGLSARDLGFILVPGFAVYTLTATLAGRFSDRWTPRPFLIAGPLVGLVGVLGLASFGPHTPLAVVVLVLVVHSASLSLVTSPSSSALLAAVPKQVYTVAVAFINLAGTIAGIVALALITAIVTAVMANAGAEASINAVASDPAATNAFLEGWRVAFLVQAVFMVTAAVIGLMYKLPDNFKGPKS